MMRRVLVSVFLLGLIPAPVFAQAAAPAAKTPKHDNSQPVQVSADKFTADLNAKTGVYTGNVLVTQGDVKLRANTVRINTVNGQADRVLANGNVVVDSPASGTATGDAGVYVVGPRTVTLTGHVVLKRTKDVMRGNELTVNLNTGQAQLGAGKGPDAQTSGRVQAIFTPQSGATGGAQ